MTPRSPRGLTRSAAFRTSRAADRIRSALLLGAALLAPVLLLGCPQGGVSNDQVCEFECDYRDANAVLTQRDVVQIIANAIAEAQANGITDFTIAVNDHLNNVLAVYDSNIATTDYSQITSLGDVGSVTDTPFTSQDIGSADFRNLGTPLASLNTALDGIFIPAGYAAISKAGTANYFSTQGNAFSSRTAGTLIQQNFFPGETDRPGGPLFAVQIAQLVCSDINTRQNVDLDISVPPSTLTTRACEVAGAAGCPDPFAPIAGDLLGPRRLPVGFAADPGGLPLYKDGIPELDPTTIVNGVRTPTGFTGRVVVGAVAVEFNGVYGVDKDGTNNDRNLEERIAWAATRGFEADVERRAPRITVAGRALRFADDTGVRSAPARTILATEVDTPGEAAATLDAEFTIAGGFVFDRLYFPFTDPRAGVNFLDPASGVIPETYTPIAGSNHATQAAALAQPDEEGEKLIDVDGDDRYAARDSVVPAVNPAAPLATSPAIGSGLRRDEVQELLIGALRLARDTRAQTRRPLGGQARIDVAVVDLDGNVLGFARSIDALLDGVDVTIAKTRQAAFWSKANARTQLIAALDPLGNNGLLNARDIDADYLPTTRGFLGLAPVDPLFDGEFAWSSIALGGVSNPDFPPGVASGGFGPLSRDPDIGEWSIFSTGLQTEIVLPAIALGLCEEVPDLAGVLFDLNAAAGLGVPAPARPVLFTDPVARDTFCNDIRTALIASPDAAQQLDCMRGVQDVDTAPGAPYVPSGNITGLQNGYHIFQGAVPIYRYNNDGTVALVGGYGVSGDGAEQDDFVPFVALDEVRKAQIARGETNPIGNAPPIGPDLAPADGRPDVQRADHISVQNVFLRYVVCPVAPFLSSNEQNGCEGR